MHHKGKATRVTRLLVEIHYLPGGTWEWRVSGPDTRKSVNKRNRKWEMRGAGLFGKTPTWDECHEAQYIGNGIKRTGELRHAPGPVQSLAASIGYDIHCLSIAADRTKKRLASSTGRAPVL